MSEIDNQYKRRFDLVPQLVSTVQGAADFEKTTLDEVTEARASVGRMQLPPGIPTDPAMLQSYMQAQQGLGAALGRLFAVSEAYPQLKATQNFLSLQDQLEGTENRIAVARRDYIDSVRAYNTTRRRFPTNFIAGMFGFDEIPQQAGRLAARSMLVVMPVIGWLLATGGTSYIGMAIKVASMGQQVSTDSTRQAGSSLLASTVIGGVAAIAVWLVLRIWPGLLLYVLLVLLVGLVMGKRIFAGAAYAPTGPVWTYAYVTMLIILGPAVLDSGDAAGARFFDRIMMFVWATVYSMFAVWFFDGIMRTRAIRRAHRRARRSSRSGDVAGETHSAVADAG